MDVIERRKMIQGNPGVTTYSFSKEPSGSFIGPSKALVHVSSVKSLIQKPVLLFTLPNVVLYIYDKMITNFVTK